MSAVRPRRTQLPGIFPTQADQQRRQAQAAVSGKIEGYAEMYKAQGYSDQEAYAKASELVEQDVISGRGGMSGQLVRAQYTDPSTGQLVRGFVTFDKVTKRATLLNGQPAPVDTQVIETGRLGQAFETAAQWLDFPSGNAVPADRMGDVYRLAQAIDAGMVSSRTEARLFTTQQGPLDPKLLVEQHLPFGTQGRQLTGQTLPTAEERTRRIAVENIRRQVEDIRQAIPKALASEKDLAGLAPNAANAILARTTKRNEFAELASNVNAVVNTLARAVQEQRGAQTEADARRAYETLVSFENTLRQMFTDPFGGDTIESADRRIAVTLAHLQIALARIPSDPVIQPVPTPAAPATPGATPAPAGAGATPTPATPPGTPAAPGVIDWNTPLVYDPVTRKMVPKPPQ
jgi:hypothetical protein